MKDEIKDANKQTLREFPMDIAIPFVTMFYGTQFASDIKFVENYMEFEFSFDHLNLLRGKQKKSLK